MTSAVNKWGLGPSLDGLFTQSNLGIVTRMTVWLMPAPESFAAFFFRSEDANGLPALIDALRPLRLAEVLRSAVHIANDYKVLGGLRQYPWDEMRGATPLNPLTMSRFRKDLTFGFWNASGSVSGAKIQVAEAKRLLRRAVSRLPGKLKFVDEKMLRLAKRYSKPFKMITGWDIGRTAELVEPVIGLMRGIPTRQALGSAYWRKRMPIPADPNPDRDRCGLVWYAPVAAARGIQVRQLTDLASGVLLKHGFEPLISLTMISPRAVNCVISITYDRDIEGEDQRAALCYQDLASRCSEAGFYPYRLGTASLSAHFHYPQDLQPALLAEIKSIVDPNRILAPGRYEL